MIDSSWILKVGMLQGNSPSVVLNVHLYCTILQKSIKKIALADITILMK